MVTYQDLIQFVIMLCAVITLVIYTQSSNIQNILLSHIVLNQFFLVPVPGTLAAFTATVIFQLYPLCPVSIPYKSFMAVSLALIVSLAASSFFA